MTLVRPLAALALAVAAVVAHPASAAVHKIVLTGVFDGWWDDRSFAGEQLVFTGRYDTDAAEEVFGEYHLPLAGLVVSTTTDSHRITEPVRYFFNPLDSLAGIVSEDATRGLLRFDWDGTQARFDTDAQSAAFASTGGALSLTGGTQIAVSFGAVPEPATWALMIVGIGATGAAMRRRTRRVLATAA